ncbi:MAG: glycoside hydrolase family 97 C-terminal domain-containing protein [Bryobacteraceae bacterium]
MFARRRWNTWFVAVLNGSEARTIRVPLTFLPSGSYKALMARDSQEAAAAIKMDQANLRRAVAIRIELCPGGGFIARLSK